MTTEEKLDRLLELLEGNTVLLVPRTDAKKNKNEEAPRLTPKQLVALHIARKIKLNKN